MFWDTTKVRKVSVVKKLCSYLFLYFSSSDNVLIVVFPSVLKIKRLSLLIKLQQIKPNNFLLLPPFQIQHPFRALWGVGRNPGNLVWPLSKTMFIFCRRRKHDGVKTFAPHYFAHTLHKLPLFHLVPSRRAQNVGRYLICLLGTEPPRGCYEPMFRLGAAGKLR